MGGWTRAGLMLNHLKLWNNRGQHLSWRWWPLTILSKNHLEVMLLNWSKYCGSVPACRADENNGNEVIDCNTSGMLYPMATFLPRVSAICRHTSAWLPAILMTVRLCIKAMFLHKEWPSESETGHFYTLNLNTDFSLALTSLIQVEDWENQVRIVGKPVSETNWWDQ